MLVNKSFVFKQQQGFANLIRSPETEGTPSPHTHVLPKAGVSMQKANPLPRADGTPQTLGRGVAVDR